MQFGAIVDTLRFSQKMSEITFQMNKLNLIKEHTDFILFSIGLHAINLKVQFAVMDAVEIYGFNHPVIATSLNSADLLINCYSSTKKYFYVYDLEWMYGITSYEKARDIYTHPEINLIARSNKHADIIQDTWNTNCLTIENFNYEEIVAELAK